MLSVTGEVLRGLWRSLEAGFGVFQNLVGKWCKVHGDVFG